MLSNFKQKFAYALRNRQIWISLIIILANAGTIIYTFQILAQKRKLGFLAGVASQQQVLIETHLSQILLQSQGSTSNYKETRNAYKEASNVLRYGGEMSFGSDSASYKILRHAASQEIIRVVRKNDSLFRKIVLKSDHFLSYNAGNPVYYVALKQLSTLHEELVESEFEVLKLLIGYSLAKNKWLNSFLVLSGLLVALLAVYLAWLVARIVRTNSLLALEVREKVGLQEELNKFFSISLDMLSIANEDGNFRKVNPSFSKILGYTPEEIINHSLFDFVHEEDRKLTHKEMDKLKAGIQSVNFINRFKCKDGTNRFLGWAISTDPQSRYLYAAARDITVQKNIQDELQKSRLKTRAVFNAIPDVIFQVHRSGLITDFKPAPRLDEIFEPGSFLDKHLHDKLPKPIAEKLMLSIQQVLQSGEPEVLEFGLNSADLNVAAHQFEARIVSVTKAEVMIIVRDVTVQKEAQKALEKSENNFSNIFEHSNDGIYIHDVKGRFLNVNRKMIDQFGYSKEEFLTMNIIDLIPEARHEEAQVVFRKIRAERSIRIEFEMKKKNGNTMPIEVSANYFTVIDKLMVQGVVRDVTERKKAEEELKNNEYQLRQILESMPVGVYILSANGTPYYANEQSMALIGKGIMPNVGVEDLPEVYQVFSVKTGKLYPTENLPIVQALGGKTVYIDDMRIHRSDDKIDLEVWAKPVFDTEQKIAFAIAVFNDITLRKAAEEQKSQLMDEVAVTNKELSEFAYIVSHDLKAPLRGIATLSSWLSTEHRENLNEEGQEYIDLIANRVARMNSLIEGILQYSKIGRTEEITELIKTSEILEEIIDLVADAENVTVKVPVGLPDIKGVKVRIGQVFQNLISNAIKHNDKPAVEIEISFSKTARSTIFRLTDNGPGIDKKFHEKIFEVFRTLKSRDDMESTGIGLSLVKKIIELHGGRIWVESEVGKGTSFVFSLPNPI